MHYNWKVYGRYGCPHCGWNIARKREDHNRDVSICCHCKTEMIELDPKTKRPLDASKLEAWEKMLELRMHTFDTLCGEQKGGERR